MAKEREAATDSEGESENRGRNSIGSPSGGLTKAGKVQPLYKFSAVGIFTQSDWPWPRAPVEEGKAR